MIEVAAPDSPRSNTATASATQSTAERTSATTDADCETSLWRLPTPSAGWTGTIVRILFGIIFGIDAVLKWLPGYSDTYISQLKSTAQGQPSWLPVVEPVAVGVHP